MSSLPSCLSSVRFGSYLAYTPRGKSKASRTSQEIMRAVKGARAGHIDNLIKYLAQNMRQGKARILTQILGSDVVIVPCPRSSLMVKGALWPNLEICTALMNHDLAARISAILERSKAVPKSSTAGTHRPKADEHLASMRVVKQLELLKAPRITVVDDVITREATLLAAASHLRHCFPQTEVSAFALIRTQSGADFQTNAEIVDPVIGEIALRGHDAFRNP